MRIKNEERWLERALASLSELVDGIVILDDGSTDRTPAICRACPKVARYEYQREATVDEVRDKNRLLAWTLAFQPDWIIALDGDDSFEDRAKHVIRDEIGRIDPGSPEVTSFLINYLYFWDREDQYVDQESWIRRIFTLWGQAPSELRFDYHPDHRAGFHCGSIPVNLRGQTKKIDVVLKHFGYLHRHDRERKYRFYAAHDRRQAARGYYDHLLARPLDLRRWSERSANDPVTCFEAEPPPRPAFGWSSAVMKRIPDRLARLVRRMRKRSQRWR